MRTKPQTGITLIEMMVVLVIIGLVGSIVAISYDSVISGAYERTVRTNFNQFGTAIDIFKFETSQFPQTLGDLIDDPGIKGWRGPYLKNDKSLFDPWGNDYIYQRQSGNKKHPYVIQSLGADGIEGGEGDNKDLSSTD